VAEQLAEDWQDRVDGRELTEKTQYEYLVHWRKLVEHFGKTDVSSITEKDVKALRKKTLNRWSAILWNRRLFVLKQVFKKAVETNAILKSPCADMKYISEKKLERCRYLMPDKINDLLDACRQLRNAKNYMPAIVLAIEHGCAKQEILDLKWSNVDFDNNKVTFYRTKNGMRRTRSMLPRTQKALLHWKNQQELMRHRKKLNMKPDPDWVFSHHDGTRIREFKTAWAKVCELAGIDDYHFHDNRHTFCTNLIYAGADTKQVNVMIGHNDMRMTYRYTHIGTDMEDDLGERLAGRYGQADKAA
jgi:integrase